MIENLDNRSSGNKNTNNIKVLRFAPSPTGSMHLGNARTAIFNFLLAKHYSGSKFYLRIEDTDKERSTKESVQVIFDSLQFLGIEWDYHDENKELIYQSTRENIYKEHALKLLESGHAYKCFCTAEELVELREQQKEKGIHSFRGPDRDLTDRDNNATDNSDKPYTVRFKTPDEGNVTFTDMVQGEQKVECKDIEDFVLLRSDGSPTYLLSVVVDDHYMNVNTVIRGADHLTNTFKQKMLFEAFDWIVPEYGHIPLILDGDGQKLSKRKGAIGVLEYAEKGVLSQALFNYLMKLGWGYGDEEFIPFERAVEIFTEKGFGKSPARFDEKKLLDLSGKYMRDRNVLSAQDTVSLSKKFIEKYLSDDDAYKNIDESGWYRFEKGLAGLVQRAETLVDLLEVGKIYLFENTQNLDSKALSDLLSDLKIDSLPIDSLVGFFKEQYWGDGSAEMLDKNFREYCSENSLIFKDIAGNLRKKITGARISPSVFDVMSILGLDISLKRLKA